MLEKPHLKDEKIIACLRDSYGISVDRIEFLPIGNSSDAWVYQIHTEQETYFLKIKKGTIYEASFTVPWRLKNQGIEQIVPPLSTKAGKLWEEIDNFSAILYPFIDGDTGMELGMSEAQWIEFGTVLKKIHSSKLPPQLLEQVKKETSSPGWSDSVAAVSVYVIGNKELDFIEEKLALFWQEKVEEIEQIVKRTEEIGRQLKNYPLDFVLCHADIHTANILIDKIGKMFIVDWDNVLIAPKERDLMFLIGEKEEDLFMKGYGKPEINSIALLYYRYEWVVQEIGDYGQRILQASGHGEEVRGEALKSLIELFQPDNVVESAQKLDPDKSK